MMLSDSARTEVDAFCREMVRRIPEDWTAMRQGNYELEYFPGADMRAHSGMPYHKLIPRYTYLED